MDPLDLRSNQVGGADEAVVTQLRSDPVCKVLGTVTTWRMAVEEQPDVPIFGHAAGNVSALGIITEEMVFAFKDAEGSRKPFFIDDEVEEVHLERNQACVNVHDTYGKVPVSLSIF